MCSMLLWLKPKRVYSYFKKSQIFKAIPHFASTVDTLVCACGGVLVSIVSVHLIHLKLHKNIMHRRNVKSCM